MELYKKYRPKKLDKMVGQEEAVEILKRKIKKGNVPHAILFSGPSGCGKTTFARILQRKLKCHQYDFSELNCADVRGIDDIRKIRSRINHAPIGGDCRIWLIDEAHKLTNDAQNAILKMLEDTPEHVYFMLATTDPQRLIRTIRTRCTEIVVKSLDDEDLESLLAFVCKQERITKFPSAVVDKIIKHSEGSARKALVLLDSVIELDNKKQMLKSIEKTTLEKEGEHLARLLLNTRNDWKKVATVLKKYKKDPDINPESLRRAILGYAANVLVSGGRMSARAYLMIDAFRNNFFDSKWAGLVTACYEVVIGID